ncbi:MFS transporter [Ancylobacter dichloromethanicus]
MGAIYLQNGVCLLPKTDDHVRRLKMLENDIAGMGGEAVILETVALDRAQEDKVVGRFKADRDEQYREFIGRCAGFEAEIAKERATNKFTYAELEEEDTDLKKLQSWLEKIGKLDFYGGTLAEEAAARLKGCEELLDAYAQQVFLRPMAKISEGDLGAGTTAVCSAERRGSLRTIPAGVWALGFVSMFMDISSEMIHALLPVYLVTVLGTSALTVGFIEGVAEATGQITRIFTGALSDRFGRRKALTALGYGLSACTKLIFPLASVVDWLVAARFIDRLGKGLRGAPRDALVADISPPHLRGASYGLRQSLDTVGALLGPLVAIALMWLTSNHFTVVFWIAVAPAFIAVGLILAAVHEPTREKKNVRPIRETGRFTKVGSLSLGSSCWLVIAIGAVFTLARFSEAFLILRAQSVSLPLMLVPAVLVVMNITYSLSAYPVGALSDRMDRTHVLAAGLFHPGRR